MNKPMVHETVEDISLVLSSHDTNGDRSVRHLDGSITREPTKHKHCRLAKFG